MFAGFAAPRQKIVVAVGHPGDPECGCAGTIARFRMNRGIGTIFIPMRIGAPPEITTYQLSRG